MKTSSAARFRDILYRFDPSGVGLPEGTIKYVYPYAVMDIHIPKQKPDFAPRETYDAINELRNCYDQMMDDVARMENADAIASIQKGFSSLSDILFPAHLNLPARMMTPAEIVLLDVVSTMVGKEEVVTDDDISTLRKMLDELREFLETTPNLDRKLVCFILEIINAADEAINKYRSRGARGFYKAKKQIVAELHDFVATTTKEERKSLPQKILSIVVECGKKLDSMAKAYDLYRPYIEIGTTFLLGNDDNTNT